MTGDRVTLTPCGGGPLLLRGADAVVDGEGREHAVERPVVALCRCERSGRLPWCDGTHRALERAARRRGSDRADAGGPPA